jgi:molybdopterin/thiamine biosynthesis adenylyltransferase
MAPEPGLPRSFSGKAAAGPHPGPAPRPAIVGALTGVIGTLMAMEAIKLITGTGEPLIGRLLLYDGCRPGSRRSLQAARGRTGVMTTVASMRTFGPIGTSCWHSSCPHSLT